ncbi:hypothetical protein CF326_g6231 [Tilletia indica]|nr:hypothetical protein CF326_g6231 [Tilletia indica]
MNEERVEDGVPSPTEHRPTLGELILVNQHHLLRQSLNRRMDLARLITLDCSSGGPGQAGGGGAGAGGGPLGAHQAARARLIPPPGHRSPRYHFLIVTSSNLHHLSHSHRSSYALRTPWHPSLYSASTAATAHPQEARRLPFANKPVSAKLPPDPDSK